MLIIDRCYFISTVSQVRFPGKQTLRCECKRFTAKSSQKQHLWGRKDRIEQWKKLGCEAVTTKASAGPKRSSRADRALWSCPSSEESGLGLYTSIYTSHWMWAASGKKVQLWPKHVIVPVLGETQLWVAAVGGSPSPEGESGKFTMSRGIWS